MLTYNLNERGTLTLYEYLYKCIKDDIVSGKIKKDELKDIILSKERKRAGKTAPPQGLYLNKINY